MAKNIVGEEVSPKKGAMKESKKRQEARAFLELGDAFGGPNRVFPFTEVREVISRAPQGDEVKGRFLEWVEHAEKSGRTQAWGHSLRHLGRTWYWGRRALPGRRIRARGAPKRSGSVVEDLPGRNRFREALPPPRPPW